MLFKNIIKNIFHSFEYLYSLGLTTEKHVYPKVTADELTKAAWKHTGNSLQYGINNFKKQWLEELKINDFVESNILKNNNFSVGIIVNKDKYISVKFYYGSYKTILEYDKKNGNFISVKSGSENINFPNLFGDQIIIAKKNRIESFIKNNNLNNIHH